MVCSRGRRSCRFKWVHNFQFNTIISRSKDVVGVAKLFSSFIHDHIMIIFHFLLVGMYHSRKSLETGL